MKTYDLNRKLFTQSKRGSRLVLDPAKGVSNGHWFIFKLSENGQKTLASITSAWNGEKWNASKLPVGFKRGAIDTNKPVQTIPISGQERFPLPESLLEYRFLSMDRKQVQYVNAENKVAVFSRAYIDFFGNPQTLKGTRPDTTFFGDGFCIMGERW